MQPGFVFDFAADQGAWPTLAFGAAREILCARQLSEVRGVLSSAEARSRAGAWVAGFVSYEAAPAFDPALRVRPGGSLPLAWFGVFDAPLLGVPEPATAETTQSGPWQPSIGKERFIADIAAIRTAIFEGEVYQVNHSLRLAGNFRGDAYAWFCRLRTAQPNGYAAYLDIGGQRILSISPELFFRREGDRLTARPMKGTAPRGRWPEEDAGRADWLAASDKNRAENLMIVDLLRNDLSRVATPHSVQVPALFSVERYPTLLQMTSTVTAQARPGTGLDDLFAALFPCGSITGAPKAKAMEIIAGLETEPRGVYCGAIGLLRPGGDAIFNVAIRSLVIDTVEGKAVCGLGSGVTWDSSAADEYDEVFLKSRFLAAEIGNFSLLETLRLEHGRYARLDFHFARLAASARYFDFAFDEADCRARLEALAAITGEVGARVRLCLDSGGNLVLEGSPLPAPSRRAERFGIASSPVDSASVWLYHKTTQRGIYDRAAAARPDIFDVLLWNERRELTEFTRGNLVLEVGGRRLTPRLDCGLLGGCRRREMLEAGEIAEAVLGFEHLAQAKRAWFINSLRGAVELALPAELELAPSP